jgi:hypothetical protein
MRKMGLFAAVVCLIFCCSLNAFGQNMDGSHYVGPSNGFTTGARLGGLGGMNNLCRATVNGAHMCNVDEFISTAALGSSNVQLWVQPVLHNCLYDASLPGVTCQEAGASELVPQTNLFQTCAAWTMGSGSTGTSVTFTNAAGWTLDTESDCSALHRAACCSP